MKSSTDSAATRPAASPQWFGAPERPLFGWLHRPAGDTARALVVLCPSMGQEAVFSHYLLRSIADDLAAGGFVVVRFDYDGTGDSRGDEHDPDRVSAWLASIEQAIALGRDHTDAPLALFGFRLGALLAAEVAARRDDVHGLTLWDAPRSGRHFLREQVMRHNASVGAAESGADGFTALGLQLTAETASTLTRLGRGARSTLPADAALVLERGAVDAVLPTVRDGRPVEHLEATDQDDLLARQALPLRSRQAVLDWFARTYPTAPHPLLAPRGATTTSVDLAGVHEHVTSVGPHGLFGIVAEPTGATATTTTVVFVPDSITPRSGLSRIWTDLARQWAELGIRSLRFDLTGCADSPVRDGLPPQTVGLLAHLDDTAAALRHANPVDPADTIVIGLCSGGYLSLEAALCVAPRGLAMVNPVLSFITPEARPDPRRRAIVLTRRVLGRLLGHPTGRLAATLSREHKTPAFTTDPNFAWDRALEACFWQVYLSDVAPWLPDRVWRVLNALLTNRTLARVLRAVGSRGTSTLLLAGDPDYVRSTLGAHRPLDTMQRGDRLRVEHLPGVDHAMMRPGDTDLVSRSLTRFVLGLTGVGSRVAAGASVADVVSLDAHRHEVGSIDGAVQGAG